MPAAHPLPRTLGELRSSTLYPEARLKTQSVKDEMRANLMARLKARETVFPGIVGYEDTVIPQIVNAVLSKQNFILLGLRGQAKSRILRALTALLDERMPYIAGCEMRDNPYAPLCRRCRELVAEKGDATPIAYLTRDDRYVEKLATPDVTVADLVGDLDPIKAARGGEDLSSELTMHYGLLPRANRGIFAINELPDLAGKIQVALFNIMQEGDVQIKGYPVRLMLDVALVFSANPEDYTARGKIITPLKDRIGSEIRTHYPETLEEGIAITSQEAWATRGAAKIEIPKYVREIVEQVAFSAREDKKVDKRSGVSQRLPISTIELVVSNAERRALVTGDALVLPRVSDIYAAMPGITGKLELEYEGEMRGADTVVWQRSASPVIQATSLPEASPATAADACRARPRSPVASASRTRSAPMAGYSSASPAPGACSPTGRTSWPAPPGFSACLQDERPRPCDPGHAAHRCPSLPGSGSPQQRLPGRGRGHCDAG